MNVLLTVLLIRQSKTHLQATQIVHLVENTITLDCTKQRAHVDKHGGTHISAYVSQENKSGVQWFSTAACASVTRAPSLPTPHPDATIVNMECVHQDSVASRRTLCTVFLHIYTRQLSG